MNAEREIDAETMAHRALVAMVLMGLTRARQGLRVVTRAIGASIDGGATVDLLAVIDRGDVAEAELAEQLRRMRATLSPEGALALVVSSPVAAAFVQNTHDSSATDAYGLACAWGAAHGHAKLAPALATERFAAFVEAAAQADLVLVEPDISIVAPGLSRVRGMRTPRARALLATVAFGSTARAAIFVPQARTPKGGVARVKVERLADGWVGNAPLAPRAEESELTRAALDVLALSPTPLSFKDLLREARERWATTARARGSRATPSSNDASDLALSLYRLAAADHLELYALDPASPGWSLTP